MVSGARQIARADVLAQLKLSLPNVDLIVPEAQRLVRLSRSSSSQSDADPNVASQHEELITLYSTDEGDPILRQFGADVLKKGEKSVVLTSTAAEQIGGVHAGDTISLTTFRRRADTDESATFSVEVKGIVPSHDNSALSGYASTVLLAQLEQYVQGYAVPELDLPAMKGLVPADEYESYLLFCQNGPDTDLVSEDFAFLAERGIHCKEIEDRSEKSLYGLLQPNRLNELKVYKLTQGNEEDSPPQTLKTSALFITENTRAVDDFALRWNPPLDAKIGGTAMRIVGLSLPTVSQSGGWIREYFANPKVGFNFEDSTKNSFQIQFVGGSNDIATDRTAVELKPGKQIPLTFVDSRPPQQSNLSNSDGKSAPRDASNPKNDKSNKTSEPPIAIVPANCLAWMKEYLRGKLEYDEASGTFSSIPDPIMFDKARIYAKTIDDVPTVVERLSTAGYAVLSESNHIAEIQMQDRSLEVLVIVVGIGVFLFGTVTVIGVLFDATERKRGTIGILRVMGMSCAGIFFVVIQRAMIVGILAAALSVAMGSALLWFMSTIGGHSISLSALSHTTILIPKVSLVFHREDYLAVTLGALLCSGLGAVLPAWRASAIDPFDAIVEGKFH